MSNLLQNIDIDAILAPEALRAFGFILLRAIAALVVLRVVVMIVRRVLRRRTTKQVTMLVTRGIGYVGLGIIVAVVLLEFGVNPGPLLGAAGIVGLAVGVASQASLSNMISGLFLVSEKPFSVGDVIRSADTIGIVESIDLLSVKIRTFDNLFIRIPNEKLANTTLVNITRYPIRRLDVKLVVPFETDLGELFEILRAIAKDDPACLQEPEPLVVPDTFTEEGIRLLFGVWFAKSDFLTVKSSVYQAISVRFREAGIRFAIPRREISARPGMWPGADPEPEHSDDSAGDTPSGGPPADV